MHQISFEEKKKFLENKLSEEEIGEVMRRYKEALANPSVMAASTSSSKSKDQVYANIKESPVAENRLQHQQSLFLQSVNVASIAILSSLGVSYVLDKIKDRQERNLREEIKDRMESTMKEANSRIRSLEAEAD